MTRSKLLIIISFFSIYVIWGSTYLLNKIAVTEIPPLLISSIRFGIAGILIMIIAKLLNHPLKITKKQLLNTTIAGFLFLVYGNGVFVWALKFVDSGFAALLASTQPLFVLFLLRLIDGKKMQRKSIIGVLLGMVGMYLLVSQEQIATSDGMIIGIFMILTCVLSWSYGSVFVSKADLPKNFFVSTGYQMIIASLMLFFCSFIFKEDTTAILNISPKVQLVMVALIFFGSIVAFTAFNYLLKNVSPEKVTTSAYVNPVIALLLGWAILDEKLTNQSILASAILLAGVYFITSRKRVTKTKVNTSQKA
ncbi:EamA family transporter [Tenacibaculum sp. M341]|uniref:EamA family transporter n=1 Tax=Tenacibaculum sp. M341 TaxID=2530339 RepID=UPI00105033B9|nr:EamA family transporter [Tenacibaculum sp. M341]TCI94866.1 EamA family transporter [Tenacibaculum sp. M341]